MLMKDFEIILKMNLYKQLTPDALTIGKFMARFFNL
jgi:hypothetical protein